MKIGICDSGLGGLTVLRAIREKFPNIDIDYLADNLRLPYGEKSKMVLIDATIRMIDFLLSRGAYKVIVACNSASSQLPDVLEKRPDLSDKVVGVIEPMADLISQDNTLKNICIIGTRATIKSGIYSKYIHLKNSDKNVSEIETPMLVPLIEEGYSENEFIYEVLKNYLSTISGQIDVCVLGCTHYPLIKDKVQKYLGDSVRVYSSGDALVPLLMENKWIDDVGKGKLELFFTDDRRWFVDEARFIFPDIVLESDWKVALI